MNEEEDLIGAMRRLLALKQDDRVAVAERGLEASREMSWRTVDDWVGTLQRAVVGKRFS
jgi:hypothetical protein